MIRGKEVCIFAIECTTLRELRYQLFSLIDERNLTNAVTVARAIGYRLSKRENAMLKVAIDLLRHYVMKLSDKRVSASKQEVEGKCAATSPLRKTA